ncbi:MAG: hypothetical protein Q9216_007192 [Gyalolechia sp. 2 TL-2023]
MVELTTKIDPQHNSPLFGRLPPEIRNIIFKLVLTAYEDPRRKFSPCSLYYRPGYTCGQRIDTALLLTCRLAYAETARLPAGLNELTIWLYEHTPFKQEICEDDKNEPEPAHCAKTLLRFHELRTIHVFVDQLWLEDASFAQLLDLWSCASPTHLILTLRYMDWFGWDLGYPLVLDPKFCCGRFQLSGRFSKASDAFEPGSWGIQLRHVRGLQVLQLELETIDHRKQELDTIVDHAKTWAVPLGDGKVLTLDESKTRRTGWVGLKLDEHFGSEADIYSVDGEDLDEVSDEELPVVDDTDDQSTSHFVAESHTSRKPLSIYDLINPEPPTCRALPTARERLEATGVVFHDVDLMEGLTEDEKNTYYVVTLTLDVSPKPAKTMSKRMLRKMPVEIDHATT